MTRAAAPLPYAARALNAIYSLLTRLLRPLVARKLARRARAEPLYAHDVAARWGHYSHPAWPDDGRTLWLHAVSLGETRALAAWLPALRSALPQARLLLTHGTATGWAQGQGLLAPGDGQTWLPWDTPEAVARFLAHHRPRLGVLLETEVWPNLVQACRSTGVPLLLANARLSAASLRAAQRLGPLGRAAYSGLHAVWAQSDSDAQGLRALGARVTGVLGNLKFDAQPDAAQLRQAQRWRALLGRRPVWLLASARDGEEAAWLQSLQQFWAQSHVQQALAALDLRADQIQLLVVPRHPQRFATVAADAQSAGWTLLCRDQWGDELAHGRCPPAGRLWLGDSLGEMALYYALADLAWLGGSFAPLGGQNLIEAAACGCPLLLGPHTFNFAEAASQALVAGAALRVADWPAAAAAALDLLGQPQRLGQMRSAALQFALAHQGAAQRQAQALAACWALAEKNPQTQTSAAGG